MGINLSVPRGSIDSQLKPRITVIGIGGAGGNAVNNMIAKNLEGVNFIVANTDAQSLAQSSTDRRIQFGIHTTEGLGAGARPEVGRAAADEALETIQGELAGSHMAFITAGMGGGTGTGAAPVVARAAREMGILTVGVVTKPFHFEGIHRMRLAEVGMDELACYVDTLIIIPNQNLFRVANERTTFAQAFNMADDVLYAGVRGVTDLIMMPGLINLDFADIRTVMSEMGKAMMGTGEAEGEKRALDAAEAAISNPLLDDTSMKGARGVLINITGGPDMTLYEVDEAANRIRDEVDPDANIIFGSTFDERLEGKVRVSVVATGIDSEANLHACSQGFDGISAREQQRQPSIAIRSTVESNRYSVAAAIASVAPESNSGRLWCSYDNTTSAEASTIPEAPMADEGQQPESGRPGFERFTTLVGGERQQVINSQTVNRAEVFIPTPAVDPKDIGIVNRSVVKAASQVNSRQINTTTSVRQEAQATQPTDIPQQATTVQSIYQTISPPQVGVSEPSMRRSQTLLERVAGIGRIRRTAETSKVDAHDLPRQAPVVDTPSLKVEPEDRPINSTDEDLDIPAFLRRQAN